ncbi:probable linoleate 9S-lipoxygenase 5 isoform X2 [Sorghum bicolor]|nr:probable linoleate 9S-lipoxygenase 5 isoform X2 [Sorghum bicolor]|eukprot:XP_021302192.1 probable linoleate 9S-lipoxygenase 5 isoform X2 [Sorghum bicolor]
MQIASCSNLCDQSPPALAREDFIAINGTVVVSCHFGLSLPGKTTMLRLFSSTRLDHNTGMGYLSAEAPLRGGKKTRHGAGKTNTMTYQVTFFVDADFGTPGAVVVKNGLRNDQIFLRYVQLDLPEDGRSIHFECNSWVYPYKKTNADRVFFMNTSYLPDKTPDALRLLRDMELRSLRGNGRGERRDWERVYDYDYYNDLGDPDKKDKDHARPVLGGTAVHPYPRRCRTGRPLFKTGINQTPPRTTDLILILILISSAKFDNGFDLIDEDGVTETRSKRMINLDFYVPPDERFSPTKLAEVLTLAVQAVTHFVVPESKALLRANLVNSFRSFQQLRGDLYSRRSPRQPVAVDAQVMDRLKASLPSRKTYMQVSKMVKETPVMFPIPQVIEGEAEAWRSDEEFAREMLAGLNPVVIKRLEVFPPVSRGGKQSSITAAHIEKQLEGRTVAKALDEKRLYILDHHDYLMPYLERINRQQGVCVYASRTLLFLKDDGTLKPLAIELSLPSPSDDGEISRVFLPASQGTTDGQLWLLAKAHVSVNDSGYHQLISH